MNVTSETSKQMVLFSIFFFSVHKKKTFFSFGLMNDQRESCNLPRCKGTPERTTCGKKPTRRKGVTTVTEPAFAGKKTDARTQHCASNRLFRICIDFFFFFFYHVVFHSNFRAIYRPIIRYCFLRTLQPMVNFRRSSSPPRPYSPTHYTFALTFYRVLASSAAKIECSIAMFRTPLQKQQTQTHTNQAYPSHTRFSSVTQHEYSHSQTHSTQSGNT